MIWCFLFRVFSAFLCEKYFVIVQVIKKREGGETALYGIFCFGKVKAGFDRLFYIC